MEDVIIQVKDGKLKIFKLVPISLEENVLPVLPVISNVLNIKKKYTKTNVKKHKITLIDGNVKKILEQHYQTENGKELNQRIKDETGIDVPISSIYNWKYNRVKKSNIPIPVTEN